LKSNPIKQKKADFRRISLFFTLGAFNLFPPDSNDGHPAVEKESGYPLYQMPF